MDHNFKITKTIKVNRIIATLIVALILILLTSVGLFQISKSRTFQFFNNLTSRVETTQKVVTLTFDDAPNEKTQEVLDILKQKGVKATFYEIGENIEKYPDVAKSIVKADMEIGNHSYSHKRFLLKSLSFVDLETKKQIL